MSGMKKQRYTESQILRILNENENGVPIKELIRIYGFSLATFYNWRTKYRGATNMDSFIINELKDENDKLKRMFAELSLENLKLKKLLERKELIRNLL
jgi:putative transposase